MGEKLIIGPNKGLQTNFPPFNIDNDSFPTLINAYQWRKRVKRKRGTSLLGQLNRYFTFFSSAFNPGSAGTFTFNLFATIPANQPNASLVPGNIFPITLQFAGGSTQKLTDTLGTGTFTITGAGPIILATVNYATGIASITVSGAFASSVTSSFLYYPTLPVMGLEELSLNPNQSNGTIAFDTTYSYNINTSYPYAITDVSFYANPAPNVLNLPGYVPKDMTAPANAWTPLTWNGMDYQQFWTTNYQGAFWATNGVQVPFLTSNIGMQFAPAASITYVGNTATTLTLTITNTPLIIGDFVFVNEFVSASPANSLLLNGLSGYVTASAPNTPGFATKTITITFPFAAIPVVTYTPGIVQYLTNRSNPAIDCIRWYDGLPTNGMGGFFEGLGWVNFMPPLSFGGAPYSLDDLPPMIYYLVGCKMIVPFKDRLLFLGPVVQSSTGVPIYLQDTIIYSQNGTPYYTATFAADPRLASTVFNPILVPPNQTATPNAYWGDITGYGGYISLGVNSTMVSSSFNLDTLIIGFTDFQARVVDTSSDIVPIAIFVINSEFGTASTFSVINMNEGVISKGNRGYLMTSQTSSDRIDLDILDQVFEVNLLNNGNERFCAQRDFINEWIYFTYNTNNPNNTFIVYPNTTLQFNYRDNSYAIFQENYTTYGPFQRASGQTWLTLTVKSWLAWNTPWTAGGSTLLQPAVIAGNQQGYVIFRATEEAGTNESISLSIQSITGNTITSPNHGLNFGDYILITGALGAIGVQINGEVFSVSNITQNTFNLNPNIISTGTDYDGLGVITRMYVPQIQTKQFPVAWDMGRKVRIGEQMYLLTKTPNSQITLQIFLSQNAQNPYNNPPIVPATNVTNNSLIYSNVLFTCPEFYTINCLNLPLGTIGNGVITTFTFNYFDLFDITTVQIIPGSLLINVGTVATFIDNFVGGLIATGTGTATGSSINYTSGIVIIAFTVAPTAAITTTNFQYKINNLQALTSSDQAQIWHRMNTSLIGDTVQLGFTMSNAQMMDPTLQNQFAEIEIHGMILDVSPSQVLI